MFCPHQPWGPVQSCEFSFQLLPYLLPRSAGICPFLCGRPQQPSCGAQLEPGRELKQCG